MKLSDDARKAIHDWRWGPYIDDPIERQEAVDAMIRVVMDAFAQLEAEVEGCRKLAHEYITAYEKFAFENGIAELKAEIERLTLLCQRILNEAPSPAIWQIIQDIEDALQESEQEQDDE